MMGIHLPDRHWSMLSLVGDTALLKQDDIASTAGVMFVALLVLCFTIIAPVCTLMCQASLWAMHLTSDARRHFEAVLEVSSLWCGLDVFLLATALVMEELGPLTAHFGGEFVNKMGAGKIIDCKKTNCFKVELLR